MENKEITKTFPVAETFLASWRYCRENRRHIAVFTLVNWLLLLLGFKFMGGTGNILFIFWCVLYYLFSCFFFRFYYNRRPYLLTHKIFDSLVPSTKILFLTLALATLLAYLPFAPLFLGFPAEMMEDYAVGFIQEYMDENKLYDMGLALVLLGFLVLARAVIVHVDWSLLLVFMVMFIDVHLLTQLPALHQVLSGVGTLSGGGLWLTAIGLSQVISNVPSTILLLNYVPPSILLAWAVNVGGFGLLPGSLANIIALRMASDRRIWWRFHLYSIPMLLWAALSGYWLFKLSA